MGGKGSYQLRVVEKRIKKILDGKLLRFVDILNEYERLYKRKAFRQTSYGLDLLQKKGIVSKVLDHFCLTSDLISGKFKEKEIQLARKRTEKIQKLSERANRLMDADIERRFQRLIEENDHTRIRQMVETLEQGNETLALALQLDSRLWGLDRQRIHYLISEHKRWITKFNQILEKGVFVCELEKAKRWLEAGFSFNKFAEAVLEAVNQQNNLEEIEKTRRHIEEQLETGKKWLSTHTEEDKDFALAQQLYELTTKLLEKVKNERWMDEKHGNNNP